MSDWLLLAILAFKANLLFDLLWLYYCKLFDLLDEHGILTDGAMPRISVKDPSVN